MVKDVAKQVIESLEQNGDNVISWDEFKNFTVKAKDKIEDFKLFL